MKNILLAGLILLCAGNAYAAISGGISGGISGVSIIPSVDDLYSLGNDDYRWRDINVSGSAVVGMLTVTGAGKAVLSDGLVVNDSQGRYAAAGDFRVATYNYRDALLLDAQKEQLIVDVPAAFNDSVSMLPISFVGGEGIDQKQDGYIDLHSADGSVIQRADLTNSVGLMKSFTYSSESLADDGSFNLPNATYGIGLAAIGTQATTFLVAADGSVVLAGKTSDFEATDSDTDACIFDGGTYATVRNRLGTAQKVRVVYFYR